MFLLLALGPTAMAQSALSLDGALAGALTDNPELAGAELGVQISAASLDAQRGTADPVLTIGTQAANSDSTGFIAGQAFDATTTTWDSSVSLQGQNDFGTGWSVSTDLGLNDTTTTSALAGADGEIVQTNWTSQANVSLSQDLLAPFRRSAERQAQLDAVDDLSRAELVQQQSQQAVLAQVTAQWWTWSLAWQQVAMAESDLESARRLEAVTQAQFDEGAASQVALAQISVTRLQAEADLINARQSARDAGNQLLLLMGQDPGQDIVPAGTGTLKRSLAKAPASELAASSLELAIARHDHQVALRQLDDASGDLLPSLNATAGAGVMTLQDTPEEALSGLVGEQALPNVSVGVELSAPLGNRTARAARDSRELLVMQAELDLESTQRSVEADVLSALQTVDAAEQGLSLAQAQLELARLSEDADQARLEAGEVRMDQFLDTRADRQAAELAVLQATFELAQAHLTLAQVSGRVDEVL